MISQTEKKQLIDKALAEYALAQESGKWIDREEFLRRYLPIRMELKTLIEDINSLNKLGLRIHDQVGPMGSDTWVEMGDLLGDYNLLREIGSGGVARVYEAIQESLGRRVAIKLFTGVGQLQPALQKKFAQEARITASLPHDHIVPVYATGCEKGIPFISMKLMDGGPTSARAGRLKPRQIATIGLQTAQALAYAHSRGILHRDIKPANILLDSQGRSYLADFGLALIPNASGPITGAGTLAYLSPEQIARPDFPPTPKGDIYALGVSLYELAAGHAPFSSIDDAPLPPKILQGNAPALKSIQPSIPEDLTRIIHKAMALLPEDRYATAEKLAEDLERFLAGQPVHARPHSLTKRFSRFFWKHRSLASAGLGSAILTLFLGMGWIIRNDLIHREQEKLLLDKAQSEQKLTALAVGQMAEAARTFRHQPGLEDNERVILSDFYKKIEGPCGQLGPDHPLRAEEALILAQLSSLEFRTGSPEKGQEYRDLAHKKLVVVASNQPDRLDIIRQLAVMINAEADNFLLLDPAIALKKNDEALFWIDKALAVKPDWGSLRDRKIWTWLTRIRILAQMNRFQEGRDLGTVALKDCQQLIQEYPTGHPLSYIRPALLWEQLAELENLAGNPDAVDRAFQQAIVYERKIRELFPEQIHLRETVGMIGLHYLCFLIKNKNYIIALNVVNDQKISAKKFLNVYPKLNSSCSQLFQLHFIGLILEFINKNK